MPTGRTSLWTITLLCTLIFLGMTVDTLRKMPARTHSDQISEQVIEGKRIWQHYDCNDCHTILPENSGHPAERSNKVGFTAFVSLNFDMIFLVMALLIAGVVQVYLQRIMRMDFLEVQNHLRLWFEVRLVAGLLFLAGSVLLMWDLFGLTRTARPAGTAGERIAESAA